MENYEQKYKEALEKAKMELKTCDSLDLCATRQLILKLFPDLKKSEDELIREEILNCFVEMKKQGCFPSKHEAQYDSWVSWLEKQGKKELVNFDEAEKEKREFVGDGFIECHADFLDFKEGHTYWFEYIGDDNYNVRSDNLLGKTYHITPCQLYTIFKKLTWLEKQSVPASDYDTLKHKFNVGDWIVNRKGVIGNINEINIDYGMLRYRINWVDGNQSIPIPCFVDDYYHLWTIKDVKKGDILQANKCILIFDSLTKDIDGNTVISSWYFCDSEKFYGMGISKPDLWSIEGVTPATKEQRDFLFQKIHEAGYKWDSNKLELQDIRY